MKIGQGGNEAPAALASIGAGLEAAPSAALSRGSAPGVPGADAPGHAARAGNAGAVEMPAEAGAGKARNPRPGARPVFSLRGH